MNVACFSAATLMLAGGISTNAQDISPVPASLPELIQEAERNNSQLLAAEDGWRASSYAARGAAALPDPQVTLQQFSVGSPRPFAGFTNSDFAYIGFGISQDIPYAGKLRLKQRVADREADTGRAQADALRTSIAEQVKTVYFHIAYVQRTLASLERSKATLQELSASELARYRAGQGSQADVLKAQLAHTRAVREITLHHEAMAELQADLKLLLNRPQGSSEIVAGNLAPTPLRLGAPELLALAKDRNPELKVQTAALEKRDAQLQSAQRGSKPDFSAGYMFQETGNQYRDYYMLTLNMRFPRRKRVNAEVAEAAELLHQAKAERDAQLQRQLAEVQKQYVAATSGAELLVEYRDGLIPQAEAAFRAGLSAYRSNNQPLSAVLLSFNDLLSLERDSEQALLDHETAVARLETLTGATLR